MISASQSVVVFAVSGLFSRTSPRARPRSRTAPTDRKNHCFIRSSRPSPQSQRPNRRHDLPLEQSPGQLHHQHTLVPYVCRASSATRMFPICSTAETLLCASFCSIWIGPPLGQFFLSAGDWGYRTSYAFFAILIPLLCLPLIYGLHRTFRRITKAAHHRFASGASYFSEAATEDYHQDTYKPDIVVVQPQSWSTLFRACREQLDLVGILLLCAGGILILLPLSLSASKPKSWEDGVLRRWFCVSEKPSR